MLKESELADPIEPKLTYPQLAETDEIDESEDQAIEQIKERTKTGQLELQAFVTPSDEDENTYEVSVAIKIAKDWHLYADVPEGSAHTKTTVDLVLPNGVTTHGRLEATARPALTQQPRRKNLCRPGDVRSADQSK